MRGLLGVAAAAPIALLCACGGSASSTQGGSTVSQAPTSITPPGSGAGASSSDDTVEVTPPPGPTASTPTPVADPCALIPSARIYGEFQADPSTSHLDAEKQTVSGNEACIYDLSGASSIEVIVSIVSASQVDTSAGGGLTIAGHPAVYRQTEGGAAEFDVVVSASDAFTVSVNVGGGAGGTDNEKPQAQDLATVVAGAYH